MSFSMTSEKLNLSFSLKNCDKEINYSIKVILSNSTGYKQNFETEEKKCVGNELSVRFNKKMSCVYYFEYRQNLKINIIRKIPLSNKIKVTERLTVLSSLISSPNAYYERKCNDKDYKETICINLDTENNNSLVQNKSLFEYFKSGVKLTCFLSFDFSSPPNIPTLNDTKMNYTQLLKYINLIISSYTNNHIFYSNGFGAKYKYSDEPIFNLNMSEKDSAISTIEKVNHHFDECIEKHLIIPEKNIVLSSLIKKINDDIYKLYEIRYYNVSFIFIRDNVNKNDLSQIKDKIIESSYLPLTIFIIGIGKNDFIETKKLIGSRFQFSSKGMEKMRNNIYFIDLIKDFSNNSEELISFTFKELYKQIIEFFSLIKCSPKKIEENNLDSIKKSFNKYNSSIWLNSINDNNKSFNDYSNPNPEDNDSNKSTEKDYNNNNNKHEQRNNNNAPSLYTPTPCDSINPGIKDNPYVGKKETPKPPEKKYYIPSNSVVAQSQIDNQYNPYLEENQKQIIGNMNQSNNSSDLKKINNVSGASEFNSTKNSEGIKNSDLMYNNNYSIDGSYRK